MKLTVNKIAFTALAIFFAFYAVPTQASKNTALRLSTPIETPNAVQFSWTGGQTNTTYSLYRRPGSSTQSWERIQMNLQGVSGSTLVSGFTLDRTWEYEMRADAP